MTKYRKLPIEIEATQWFKNGDHPFDLHPPECPWHTDWHACDCGTFNPEIKGRGGVRGEVIDGSIDEAAFYETEGKVVSRYRHPDVLVCPHCERGVRSHGWIDTVQGGHVVCPGDWIITDDRVSDVNAHGHYYPCKNDIFIQTYEEVV